MHVYYYSVARLVRPVTFSDEVILYREFSRVVYWNFVSRRARGLRLNPRLINNRLLHAETTRRLLTRYTRRRRDRRAIFRIPRVKSRYFALFPRSDCSDVNSVQWYRAVYFTKNYHRVFFPNYVRASTKIRIILILLPNPEVYLFSCDFPARPRRPSNYHILCETKRKTKRDD